MDVSKMIVDLLRNSKEEEILNRGGLTVGTEAERLSRPTPKSLLELGGTELTVPGYAAYKREALANGEPVMSPEEFKNAARQ